MRNKQVEFNPYIYTLSKLSRFGQEISVLIRIRAVFRTAAGTAISYVTYAASWKNGCQNFSYVHRSRKHWKCKYCTIQIMITYSLKYIYYKASIYSLWQSQICIMGGVKLLPRLIMCCVSTCRRRSTFLWNARPHFVHAKGLNPECFLLCVIRLDDWLKALPHCRHLCGFSPE